MRIRTKFRRPSFTLIEMTIVIAIIGILAAMAMSVYATALAQSKAHRTRTMIAKIDQLIGEKYESYRTRQVPIRINPGTRPVGEPFSDTFAKNAGNIRSSAADLPV